MDVSEVKKMFMSMFPFLLEKEIMYQKIAEHFCKHFGTPQKNNHFHDVEHLYRDGTPQIDAEAMEKIIWEWIFDNDMHEVGNVEKLVALLNGKDKK